MASEPQTLFPLIALVVRRAAAWKSWQWLWLQGRTLREEKRKVHFCICPFFLR
jgi:hypothetical protein